MESNDRTKMIQWGFDGFAVGYVHPLLSFLPETAKFPLKCINFKQLHLKEIAEILGEVGFLFGTGVLVGVGESDIL